MNVINGARSSSLKAIRKGQLLTLAELSKRTGFAVSTINNIENGRAKGSAKFYSKLAAILNAKESELLQVPSREDWRKLLCAVLGFSDSISDRDLQAGIRLAKELYLKSEAAK